MAIALFTDHETREEKAPRLAAGTVLPCSIRKLTVGEYHRMIAAEVLGEDDQVELLEGWLVPKMGKNPPHDAIVDLLLEVLRSRLSPDWRIRIQSAITTSDSEPEPDLALCRGKPLDYLHRHPGPQDIALVIEVSDSSLLRDRFKRHLYARAGLPHYWIVNLVDKVIEVHSEPSGVGTETADYRTIRIATRKESLTVEIPGEATWNVAVAHLIPE